MSAKTPPAWAPEIDRKYPFRVWLTDLELWVNGTELPTERQGPAVAMRVGGTARELLREMDPQELRDGVNVVENGAQRQYSGVQLIVKQLRARFAPLAQELQGQALSDVFKFARRSHESVDDVLTRFELFRDHRGTQDERVRMGLAAAERSSHRSGQMGQRVATNTWSSSC